MATRTTTLTNRRNTRNSRNAGETPGIAFGTQVPSCTAPTTTSKRNSDRTVSNNPRGSLNGIPRDDDFGDNGGNDDPNDPDDPDDDSPGDLIAVFYTPPQVLVDSWWTPGSPGRLLVDSWWSPGGVLVDSCWTPGGVRLETC